MSSPPSPSGSSMARLVSGLKALLGMAFLLGLLWMISRPNLPGFSGLSRELETAQTVLKAGDVARAQALFDRALQTKPNDLPTYLQILELCQQYKQWNLMSSYAQSALCVFKYEPNLVRSRLNLVLATAYEGAEPKRPRKNAIYAAQSAWQLDRDNPDTQNGYGYILADSDQKLDEALTLIQKALQTVQTSSDLSLKSQLPAIEDSYGWVLYKKGRYKEAADMLLKALYDYPEGTSSEILKVSHYHLGATYRQMGEFEEARQALNSALYYDPQYADAREERDKLPATTSPTPPVISPPPSSK